MKRLLMTAGMLAIAMCVPAWAADAETSASAGGGRGRGGQASATARYEGDVGFARTDSRSGRVSTARGVAVGVDEDGLALSVSNAVSVPGGRAIATNLSIEIERDGDVSISTGTAVSRGPLYREAGAGGAAGRGGATSFATGRTDPLGSVVVKTDARQHEFHRNRRCFEPPRIGSEFRRGSMR